MGSSDAIQKYIGYLRVLTLLFDFWGLWLLYCWIDRRTDFVAIVLVSVLNIGYSYNTLIWGQIDGIMATLIFAAFYFQWKGRPVTSGIMMVLALNLKLQALVFLPLWGLLLLHGIIRSRRWRTFPLIVIAMASVQAIILIPFAFGPGGLQKAGQVLQDNFNLYPFTTTHAANMWYWFVPVAEPGLDTTIGFAGLSFRRIGLSLFCIASLFAFLPLLRVIFQSLRRRTAIDVAIDPQLIWLTAALHSLLAFFITTQMHERYAHGAAIFIAAYAFYTRRWTAYILFSIACFLNLEWVMNWLGLPNYDTLVFDPRFVAVLFSLVIIILFYALYRNRSGHKKQDIMQHD